jgi:cell division septation protein DedD
VPVKKVEALNTTIVHNGVYTIQVASFKGKSNAQKEADLLRKRGYKASFLNSGSYVILCVGNFPNKETAQALLPELSKYYKDCRIRRL